MPTVTLSQLTSRIYSRLDNNTQLYQQYEITSACNEAIRCSNLVAGYIQVTVPFLTRPNQVWYNVPRTILIPLRLQFETVFLEKFALSNLGAVSPEWLTETTATTGVPVAHWASAGISKIAIHPADAIGGNMLQLTGIQEPKQLVLPSDVISFPNEFSEMIEDMAVVTLVMKEGGKIFSDATVLYAKYLSKLKQMKLWQSMKMPAYWVEEVQEK